MSDKSAQKKKYIIETSRRIFMEKGYKEVTMKDIVEACQISRGGLYLYFSSTKELFEEVLKMEQEDTDDVFARSITEETTPSDILALFLKEQKKELLNLPARRFRHWPDTGQREAAPGLSGRHTADNGPSFPAFR